MSEMPRGPTIILIGGEITLDSGARVDSRRPLSGDDWDFTLRAAVGGSEAFWQRAKALSDLILDEHPSSDAWALAWVNKTIKRPRADGTFTRVRTVKLLDDADQLMDRSLARAGGAIDSTGLDGRYRILRPYLRFPDLQTSSDPAVFVGAFHSTYEDGTDIVGLAPMQYVLSRWPKATLVLPHTPLIERKTRALIDWHRERAMPPALDEYGRLGLAENRFPLQAKQYTAAFEATAELRGVDPYIVDHDLGLSLWVDQGEIKDAADLEAALSFVMSRYDLDIGLWDLARDPVLRMSLLDPEGQVPVSTTPAEVPQVLVDAAVETAKERRSAKQAEHDARRSLHDILWRRLEGSGWEVPPWKDNGTEYRLGVGPEVESPYEGVDNEPAVFFNLAVHKRQATLNLFAATRIKATEDFLASNADDIDSVAGRRPEPSTNTVLRIPGGGWDGSLEVWEQDLRLVSKCVDLLAPRLRPVIDEAVEFRRQQLADMAPVEIVVSVDVGPSPKRSNKPRFLRRRRGRD